MTASPKSIVVVIDSRNDHRVAEALRAAVGLGLRGDKITVAMMHKPAQSDDIAKAMAALQAVGHTVTSPDDGHALVDMLRGADAVEVWH